MFSAFAVHEKGELQKVDFDCTAAEISISYKSDRNTLEEAIGQMEYCTKI